MGIRKELLEDLAEALDKLTKATGQRVSISTRVVEPGAEGINIIGRAVYSVGYDYGTSWSEIKGLSEMSIEFIPHAVNVWIAGRESR